MQTNMDDQIRARAYTLWESEGRPEGRAEEYWHRAAMELLSAGSKAPVKRAKSATTTRRRTAKAA